MRLGASAANVERAIGLVMDQLVARIGEHTRLLGLATGAPYFHAGNARTLEGLFSSTFSTHMKALSPNFLDDDATGAKRAALIQFLLSIDDDAMTVAGPAMAGADGGDFCAP